MKHTVVSALCCSAVVLVGALPLSGVEYARAPLPLRVMTYNLRYASETPPQAWSVRRPILSRLVAREAPDVLGTQEGLYSQLKDLENDLPAYAWIGLGRDGGSRGEFMAVFYKRERFEPVAFEHFWLSDTPEVIGSATWGHGNRRMVTWVRLREKQNGQEFLLWNTHFDHEIEAARVKAAALVRDRAAAADQSVPLILVGDFNCAAGRSRAYEILVGEGGFADAWTAAGTRVNEGTNTFNDFTPARQGGERIDWVLVRGPVTVSRAETVTYAEHDRYPSDHFPVVVDMLVGR